MSLSANVSLCLSSKFNLAPTFPLKFAICTCVSAMLFSCEDVSWFVSYKVWDLPKKFPSASVTFNTT